MNIHCRFRQTVLSTAVAATLLLAGLAVAADPIVIKFSHVVADDTLRSCLCSKSMLK